MHCKKCGAETLESSLFCRLCGHKFRPPIDKLRLIVAIIAVAMILFGLLMVASNGYAQGKPRQVWIRMKPAGNPTLIGELVKMDNDTIDFKVKGILQSLKLDDVIAVLFVPPIPPTEVIARAQAAQKDARERQARLDEAIKRESQPTPAPAPAPPTSEVTPPPAEQDNCQHHNVTIEKGHYHHLGFANNLHDFHYKGTFKSNGGKVDLYITDTENFAKFMNHKKFQAFYSIEKVKEGSFDIGFQKGVDYHLVILNPSVYDGVSVDTDFCFSHPDQ